MWIEFKNYQEKAIAKLKYEANELLDSEGNKICIFKAPTGSGKTLMMAEFLKRLIDSRVDGKKFSFIWIAVNKLHDQSRNSLKKYYDQYGVGLKCSYFEDLDERKIAENEILFLNWASINKKDKSVVIRANERDNNLSNVVARTKDEGRIIILVIDESHHTAGSVISKEIIDDIGPKLTIEVSATPHLTSDYKVPVEPSAVRSEEMIKKEIIINGGFGNYIIDKRKSDETADEIVLKAGLEKRAELKKKFETEGSGVNPLLLIQLPDRKEGVADKKDEIEALLKKYGYTTENGRLAIYLTGKESKINLDNIEKNENEIEVMLFKQAIALGWDCPRATILVLFRQWREENMTFSTQTLGRIMRMPEQKHYADDGLNAAYVFTSLPDINTRIEQSDIFKDLKVFESKRIREYRNINLLSYHSKRFREETRLSSDFVPVFLDAAKRMKLKDKVSLKHSLVGTKLIKDGKIVDVDKEVIGVQKKGILNVPKNSVELQNAFDMFVRENLGPFAPEQRSIKRINDSIYKFFGAERDEDRWTRIQAVVLAEENRPYFVDAINKAIEMYQEVVGRDKNELVANDKPWNVRYVINYDRSFAKKDYKKSVMQPYYSKEDSKTEEDFIEYINKAKKVKWWFRNGDQDGSYLAVPYTENGQDKPFYLDFVLMLINGKIGLFDTKGGIYAKTAKERAEGLARYIAVENKKGKKIFGGIVIKDRNSWRYNDDKEYNYNSKNLKGWQFLDLNR